MERQLKDIKVEMRNGCVFIQRWYNNGDYSTCTVTTEAFDENIDPMINATTEEEITNRLYPQTA